MSARAILGALRRLVPSLTGIAAAALVYAAVGWVCMRWLGPPGFDVEIRTVGAAQRTHVRVPALLAPELTAELPPTSGRTARAVFLAERGGVYNFLIGTTARTTLLIDGRPLLQTFDDRQRYFDVWLNQGPHPLEVETAHGEAEGAIMLGVRPPTEPWRAHLVGAGDVVAAPLATVRRRLGPWPALYLRGRNYLPALAILLGGAALFGAIGRARRRRVLDHFASLRADEEVRRAATGLALLALALPVLAPLFATSYYECHEEESFIVRLHQFHEATRAGVPLGRWWPDPVFGRGYPFLCFYAPLLYLAAWPFLAVGIDAIPTMKLLSAAIILVGAGAIFLLVRRRASRPAAFLASALFLYAPYLHYDLYVRGALTESLGFAFLPISLIAMDHALDPLPDEADRREGRRRIAWVALAIGALGCAHNITAYFSMYFLGLFLLMRLAVRHVHLAGLARAVAGGVLGLLLTVFYAVPAILDRTRVDLVKMQSGAYYWALGFSDMDRVLHANFAFDRTLGLPLTAVVVVAIGALVRARVRGPLRASPAMILALTGVAGAWLGAGLITKYPLGTAFYTYMPLANFVGFPWRLFLPATVFAILASAGAIDGWFESPRARWIAAAVTIAFAVACAWPRMGPEGPLHRHHLHEEKFLQSWSVDYVTSMNEYLPKTVSRQIGPFHLIARAIDSRAARLEDLERAPGRYRARAVATAPSEVQFNCHWFPGWRAFVDGNEVPIGPGSGHFDKDGLIRVLAPPGTHEIVLRYGRTPLRWACDLASLGALLFVLSLLYRSRLAPAR